MKNTKNNMLEKYKNNIKKGKYPNAQLKNEECSEQGLEQKY
jgi:hypothetical protein